jgi:hypothetical protein
MYSLLYPSTPDSDETTTTTTTPSPNPQTVAPLIEARRVKDSKARLIMPVSCLKHDEMLDRHARLRKRYLIALRLSIILIGRSRISKEVDGGVKTEQGCNLGGWVPISQLNLLRFSRASFKWRVHC